MLIPTGKRVIRPCKSCGRELEHHEGEAHTHPNDGTDPEIVTVWLCDNHTAPCGLPCFAGGVSGKVYKSGQFHRSNGECPKCKEQPC
jgi:hypothetical protein